MAIFDMTNISGIGFEMFDPDGSQWSYLGDDPFADTEVVADDGFSRLDLAVFDHPFVDGIVALYSTDGYEVVIHDVYYYDGDLLVLATEDVNIVTTVDYLDDVAWFENLNLGDDTFYGNDFRDVIKTGLGNDIAFGYAGNDDIRGGFGDDDLYGGNGNDTLVGEANSDYLVGGLGKDILKGGSGEDFFDFNSRKESVVGANRDAITDFRRGDDTLDLRNIDARADMSGNQAFKWIGKAAFTGVDGQLRMSNGILQGDTNGDRKADFEIKINTQLYSSDILF